MQIVTLKRWAVAAGLFIRQRLGPAWAWLKGHLGPLTEVALIVLWAMWVGRNYLDFDPTRWPHDVFAFNVQGYFSWSYLRQCGLCVLWNGSINGGSPAWVETLGAIVHPLVVLPILIWGVID
jgi:hypothetical protein